jgi:hypothetical protein
MINTTKLSVEACQLQSTRRAPNRTSTARWSSAISAFAAGAVPHVPRFMPAALVTGGVSQASATAGPTTSLMAERVCS